MSAHRLLVCILTFVYCLFNASIIFAGDPPLLTSPTNSSTVPSSTLNWQAPSYPVCSEFNAYRVQVDDDPAFPTSSIYRNIYTKNTYYTPQLTLGTWYWRVMVRDTTCNNWSSWSSVWSFTIQSTPTPTPTPSPTPSSTLAPTPTPTSSLSSSLFTISNIPSEINSDQAFTTSVNLSLPNNSDTTYYLAGAFKIVDGTRYFGLTKKDSGWVQYSSASFSNQYKITTNGSGAWTGNLEVKPDIEDSDYKGSGDYTFKVARYTQTGSQTWSNEVTVKIISVETSEQGGTSADTSSSTSKPLTSPSVLSSGNKSIISTKSKSYDRLVYHTASVAAATASTSPSSTPEKLVKSQKINYFAILGSVLVISGIALSGYIYFKYRK